MPSRLAQQAALLAALLVLLARGFTVTPSDLTVAGAAALVVYGLLTLGRPVFDRIAARAPSPHDD